jgi:hypothetical protein
MRGSEVQGRRSSSLALVAALATACSVADRVTPTDHVAPDAATAMTPAPDAAPEDAAPAPPPADVHVVLTADNAYSFGYGDGDEITAYFPGTRAQSASEIFSCGVGPEAYVVPGTDAPPGAYLYVVSWDDLRVTQGILGQFTRDGLPVYTGSEVWEVCATGVDLSSSTTGPTRDELDERIAICNAGGGDPTLTSAGWVDAAGAVTPGAVGRLAIGEENAARSGGTTFPVVCPTGSDVPPETPTLDAAARWMWYSPSDAIDDPFRSNGTNRFRAYLIFRLAGADIPGDVE